MKVLQINATVKSGSTGRIADEIGNILLDNGHESYIAYGRGNSDSNSTLIKIGNISDIYAHGIYTLAMDRHGFGSTRATKNLIDNIYKLKPDIVVLHNLHGYYLNIELLFNFLKSTMIPVVWTLHDCWAFTGHCSYFEDIDCSKWKKQCQNCPKYSRYPSSWVDNSYENYIEKKRIFNSISQMQIICYSNWLGNLVRTSFLKNYDLVVTPSGINLDIFKPTISSLREEYNLMNQKVILGCANIWSIRKGYQDFIKLSKDLPSEYKIVMIGLNKTELKGLPENIIGLERTESIEELSQWYSLAFVFLNPTSQDNFPTSNIESLACGTPVITYNTGGSPESIDEKTGFIIDKGDISGILDKIEDLSKLNYADVSQACRKRAEQLYDKNDRYLDYLKIFEKMLSQRFHEN